MTETNENLEGILRKIDLDISNWRAEIESIATKIEEAETARHYLVSLYRTSAAAPVPQTKPEITRSPSQGTRRSSANTQKQRVIDLAIAILIDRENQPIQRDELWAEMQARGLSLSNAHPTHYIASKVLGDAKHVFANRNGYYLLDYPPVENSSSPPS